MSSTLYDRLYGYKLCFHYEDEFILKYIITTENGEDAKILEKELLKLSKGIPARTTAKATSKEFKTYANESKLKEAIVKACTKTNKDQRRVKQVVVFTEDEKSKMRFKVVEAEDIEFKSVQRPSIKRGWATGNLKEQNYDYAPIVK